MSTLQILLSGYGEKYIYDHPSGEFVRWGKLQHDLDHIEQLEAQLKDCLSANEGLAIKLSEQDEQLKDANEVIAFYAKVNNPHDLGSWDMRRNFIFDIIQGDDCDQAHYDISKYRFGGKRAREYQAKYLSPETKKISEER
jgi:hypothetical protein